jgi:Skp family chaperone for outer membrane proteins
MRVVTVVVAIGIVLTAAQSFAQQAAVPGAPAPAPQTAAPAPAPAAPAPAAPAPPQTVPFPAGAKMGFIDVPQIIAESIEGIAASARVKALNDRKVEELNEKNKILLSDQQKLQSGATVLSASAREELQRKIDRQNTDIERTTQDAQKELQDLQQGLQAEFQRMLTPVIAEVSAELGLHMVFSVGDAGLAWANPGLNITADVIKRFDTKN